MLKSKMLTVEPLDRDEAPGEITGGDSDLIAQALHVVPAPLPVLDDQTGTAAPASAGLAWTPSSYVIWVYPPDAPPPNSRPQSVRRAGHCH